jgi:hypothetical protein
MEINGETPRRVEYRSPGGVGEETSVFRFSFAGAVAAGVHFIFWEMTRSQRRNRQLSPAPIRSSEHFLERYSRWRFANTKPSNAGAAHRVSTRTRAGIWVPCWPQDLWKGRPGRLQKLTSKAAAAAEVTATVCSCGNGSSKSLIVSGIKLGRKKLRRRRLSQPQRRLFP